jgi:glucosamine kinase
MILVADSGSSKTDWMGYTPEGPIAFSTQGINPYFLNAQEILKLISKKKEIAGYAEQVKEIYFYGAGCSSPDKHEVISNGLSAFFPNAFISVDNDLIGSAYATCGDDKGLTCILGTGSNISYYDGHTVHNGRHGLGYVLGDEGSGTWFGKKLITSYLYKTMPSDLQLAFAKEFEVNKETIITNVYQKPFPNTYLASFSRFMSGHKEHPYILQLLTEGFQEFINSNIKDYPEHAGLHCHFVGSIAYHFRDVLTATCLKNGINLGKILQKPIEGIYQYVLKKEGVAVSS